MLFPRIFTASAQRKLKIHLKRGGLVTHPTKSCYGLGYTLAFPRALSRVVSLKRRSQDKGMIVIGSRSEQLQSLLERLSEKTIFMLEREWPVPKILLLLSRAGILPLLRGKGRNKLAVRVPAHQGVRRLCKVLGTSLMSTSCNCVGKRPRKIKREVRRQLGRKVWMVSDLIGGQEKPSQIIDGETDIRLR